MTWKLLQLAFPLVFIGIALHLYRKNRPLLIGFREQLAVSPSGRRFIVLAGMLVLIVYHFVALCGTAKPFHLLPSSILVLSMFSQRCGERIIRFFQYKPLRFSVFVTMLGAFFLPQTTPMAMTMMVLLIISWGYPTEELMREVSERGDTHDIVEETVEGLKKEMTDIFPTLEGEAESLPEEASDVDAEPLQEDTPPESEVEEIVSELPNTSSQPSEKAIRNQKNREKERERRHNRAKRRARRAKHGH